MFDPVFSIAGRELSEQQPPFIIAELSGNHQQDFEQAQAMIRAAAAAGVDAIKLQTYTADTLTLDSDSEDFRISESDNLWRGENLHSLYSKASTPWEWHQPLFDLAAELGVIAFSSPFDESSVEFLETLDVPCYKIASFELNHGPLLQTVAATGKPVIMSIGMASLGEIEQALRILYDGGCRQLALLQCTSAYPAPESDANLRIIADLKSRFQLPAGLSDHCRNLDVAKAAVAAGANLIERHMVLSADSGAVDGDFSSTPEAFAELVAYSRRVQDMLGRVHYGPAPSEQGSVRYRRSIYCCKPIGAGEAFTADNIKVVRPGNGLEPVYWDELLGKRASRAIAPGTAIAWHMVAGAAG